MIINNIDELKQYVNSLFDCKYLSEKDKEEMKKAIVLALKNIPGTREELKAICKYELTKTVSEPDESKVFFCMQILSEEENKEFILHFIKKESFKYNERKQKLLIKMLDFLSKEEDKIKISSKLSCESLFELIDSMNYYTKRAKFFQKKYYKNYYNIFREALELKSQR